MDIITLVIVSPHSVGAPGLCLNEYTSSPACEKCMGSFACGNVADKSKIGCGSCLGDYACRDISSDVTIVDGSCLGYATCSSGGGELNIVWLDRNKTCRLNFVLSAETIYSSAAFLLFHSQRGRQQLVSFCLISIYVCWCPNN